MRRTPALFFAASRSARLQCTPRKLSTSPPIVRITNGTFYRRHPASKPPPGQDATPNPPLFPNLNLTLPSFSSPNQHWAILSPSSSIRTAFLQILRGQYLCFPPTARSFPYLLSDEILAKDPELRYPERAIEYVGFDAERQAFGGAYLSARYESRVEETDFSLERYLVGDTNLNVSEEEKRAMPGRDAVMKMVRDLELERLLERPVSQLSNGQGRRARIGVALLRGPECLCLDGAFIGLDPLVTRHISTVLHRLAEARSPRIVLSLRPQDAIPDWITHIVYACEDGTVDAQGPKEEVFGYLKKQYESITGLPSNSTTPGTHEIPPKLIELRSVGRHLSSAGAFSTSPHAPVSEKLSRDAYPHTSPALPLGEPIVEISGARIAYHRGSTPVLGNWTQPHAPSPGLHLALHRNQRMLVAGPNGSGKTTLLALVTSDHPQTYSAPVKLFGRSRLPTRGVPGISIFDLQRRMGLASPEVHALFPRHLSVRRVLESAWADTPAAMPDMDSQSELRVERALAWWAGELHPHPEGTAPSGSARKQGGREDLGWATTLTFGDLPFSAQRLALFLRATLSSPEILILDEAFSGMDDLVRDKCMLFLARGEAMALTYTAEHGPQPVESALSRSGDVVIGGLDESQALLVVSHSREEVPGCVREWVCLPEAGTGEPPRFGTWDGPVELDSRRWEEVWGLK